MATPSLDAVNKQIQADQTAWFHSGPEEQQRLHEEVIALQKLKGVSDSAYDPGTGLWRVTNNSSGSGGSAPAPTSAAPTSAPQTMPIVNPFPQVPMPMEFDTSKTPITKSDADRYIKYGFAAVVILVISSIFR